VGKAIKAAINPHKQGENSGKSILMAIPGTNFFI
jgi:hypothetical protein